MLLTKPTNAGHKNYGGTHADKNLAKNNYGNSDTAAGLLVALTDPLNAGSLY